MNARQKAKKLKKENLRLKNTIADMRFMAKLNEVIRGENNKPEYVYASAMVAITEDHDEDVRELDRKLTNDIVRRIRPYTIIEINENCARKYLCAFARVPVVKVQK